MDNEREKQLSSLELPNDCDMKVFDVKNWNFSETTPQPYASVRLSAGCSVSGYENLMFSWDGTEGDIGFFGDNDSDTWIRYVKSCFSDALNAKRDQHLSELGLLIGQRIRNV